MLVLFFFFLMIRRPPRSTLDRSSAASDVYKRQFQDGVESLTDLVPGMLLEGVVTNVTNFGAFVDILSLIHISEPTRPY